MSSSSRKTDNHRLPRQLAMPRRSPIALRMAPLIDVIFLLLIFFFIAARWRPQEAFLPLQLPAAQAAGADLGKAEPVVIRISPMARGCSIRVARAEPIAVNDETAAADYARVLEELNSLLARQRRLPGDPVEIICESGVRWQHLTATYNLFYGAGLTDITFDMTE